MTNAGLPSESYFAVTNYRPSVEGKVPGKDAEMLVNMWLKHYVDSKLPPDSAITEYRINSIDAYKVVKDDYFVFSVDYDVKPKDMKKYIDGAFRKDTNNYILDDGWIHCGEDYGIVYYDPYNSLALYSKLIYFPAELYLYGDTIENQAEAMVNRYLSEGEPLPYVIRKRLSETGYNLVNKNDVKKISIRLKENVIYQDTETNTVIDLETIVKQKVINYIVSLGGKISSSIGYDKKDLEAVVKNAILTHNSRGYMEGEAQAEGHKILRSHENDGVVKVYSIISYGEFGFENGVRYIYRMAYDKDSQIITFSKETENGSIVDKFEIDAKDGEIISMQGTPIQG